MFGEEFIHQQYLDDVNICDEIINYFENSPNKYKGMVRGGAINKNAKDSTDCFLKTDDIESKNYITQLQKVVDSYIEKFPRCNFSDPWTITQHIQIQKYEPGQAYHNWHAERCSAITHNSTRHLVFMTYLNDVTDGGGTEFYHQKFTTKARKGLTLIWPADWTFTHRGEVSMTQTKYIVTGWFNYYQPK